MDTKDDNPSGGNKASLLEGGLEINDIKRRGVEGGDWVSLWRKMELKELLILKRRKLKKGC